jgi:hypothetical protein
MKSRIQLAGGAHGSHEKTVWKGDLPVMSGIPGMRFTLYTPPFEPTEEEPGEKVAEQAAAFTFRQVCFEINTKTGEVEQVVYVVPVDKTKPIELVE